MLPPRWLVKAILLPSGDQAGVKSGRRVVGEVRLTGAVGVHDVDLVVAVAVLVKAILLPSGDHAGRASSAAVVGEVVWPEPSAFMT